eukprot:1159289-Pelagomonas_calceolata.AAC.2
MSHALAHHPRQAHEHRSSCPQPAATQARLAHHAGVPTAAEHELFVPKARFTPYARVTTAEELELLVPKASLVPYAGVLTADPDCAKMSNLSHSCESGNMQTDRRGWARLPLTPGTDHPAR